MKHTNFSDSHVELSIFAIESDEDLNSSTADSDDEQDTSTAESGDEQDTSTAEPNNPVNLSNQHLTLTSTPNEDQGDDDTVKAEGLNETATDSGMGTSGIFSETSAQTKTSEWF